MQKLGKMLVLTAILKGFAKPLKNVSLTALARAFLWGFPFGQYCSYTFLLSVFQELNSLDFLVHKTKSILGGLSNVAFLCDDNVVYSRKVCTLLFQIDDHPLISDHLEFFCN